MRIASGRVREIFKKLENGDGAAFFEHVADDVDWTVMGTHGIAINVNAATRQNGDASPVTATHCRPQDRRAFVIRLRDCFTSLFDRFFGEPRSESLCDIDVRDKGGTIIVRAGPRDQTGEIALQFHIKVPRLEFRGVRECRRPFRTALGPARHQPLKPNRGDRIMQTTKVAHRMVKVHNLDVFYREAGSKDAPTVILLHGFPTSSQMFRNLIPALGDRYHVVAPDYPGFGHSSMPPRDKFAYTFDNLAEVVDEFTATLGLSKYALYVQDYGAPIGYRLASRHPERVTAIVVQNGNAYDEGLESDFWRPLKAYWHEPNSQAKRDALRAFLNVDATRWQYTHGVPQPEFVSPDGWTTDQYLLDRKGNDEIQLDLFLSYGGNPPLYPKWQEYFRQHQPPMLIVWGRNDEIFPAPGAEPYRRDLKTIEFHLLDAGHFALESEGDLIARLMLDFLDRHVASTSQSQPSSKR